MPVTDSNAILERLDALKADNVSWRKIATLEPFQGIPPRTIWKMWKTRKIAEKWREQLELPPEVTVICVNGSAIPAGAQVHHADYCVKCSRPYISNHPLRRRCFVCSPYRGKK